ncbi:MAG: polya polymerase [Lachnospiraceae bacterium]|nr:polya polymerase [Lachnospiraceae bacterium]
MTLENVTNIEGLFEVIDQCKGSVKLVSEEGDQINLKSKLAQLLSIAGVFASGYIKELELNVEEPEDMDKIMEFVVSGESVE